jgi:UDP-N-acetylmuramyl tripeptide synthase
VAVTGTNGKTSVTQWIGMTHPRSCAIIGTLGAGLPGQLVDTGFTTPEATTLMRYLAAFAKQGGPGVCARGEFDRHCRRTPRRGSD